jgi:enamine deaminase RidA (YjgF/YER057c/UK114 family)
MPKIYNSPDNPPPSAHFKHIAEVAAGGRMFYFAGQTGRRPDGTLPDGIEAQTEQAYRNVLGLAGAAGLSVGNIVHTMIYMTDRNDLKGMHDAQIRVLGEAKPPSALIFVSGLAMPQMLIEIVAVAAAD